MINMLKVWVCIFLMFILYCSIVYSAPVEITIEYNKTQTTCIETWSCTSWSACVGGTQTRTCKDLNNCGTVVNRPTLTQTCTVVCTESWSCSAWSTCTSGTQTRTCTDANKCGTTVNKPILSQNCTASQPNGGGGGGGGSTSSQFDFLKWLQNALNGIMVWFHSAFGLGK
jgi:hypothetical protein